MLGARAAGLSLTLRKRLKGNLQCRRSVLHTAWLVTVYEEGSLVVEDQVEVNR